MQAFLEDEARTDPMERALFEARLLIEPNPAYSIATASDGGLHEKFSKARLRRFEARGCHQLSASDWQAETRDIAKTVTIQLARRYRDFLR
jgi:hypothetical protein